MYRYRTRLVVGGKRPYDSWVFLIIPPELADHWGRGQKTVRGTIAGHAFRRTAGRGEGVVRVPLPRELRARVKLERGDTVDVALELDATPRRVRVPAELRAVFEDDPEARALFAKLPPSYRREWASYIAEAKRPETRVRRADKVDRMICSFGLSYSTCG